MHVNCSDRANCYANNILFVKEKICKLEKCLTETFSLEVSDFWTPLY